MVDPALMVSSQHITGPRRAGSVAPSILDPLVILRWRALLARAALAPTAGKHQVVMWMHGIDVGARVGLARHERGLLVDEAQAMPQRCHSAFGVAHTELLLNHGGHLLGGGVQMALQVCVKPGQPCCIGGRSTTAIGDLAQGTESAPAIGLEVVAHRIGVDWQDLCQLLRAPAGCKQQDGLDPVGLALVVRRAVCLAQPGEFFGAECVVEHGAENIGLQRIVTTSDLGEGSDAQRCAHADLDST